MANFSNYHCHSAFSDGQGKMVEFVSQAIALGIQSMGFSEHAPVPFDTFWNMPVEKLDLYLAEIEELKKQYQGQIEIYTGLEVDYYKPWQEQISIGAKLNKLDFFIGSIHFLNVFPNNNPWNIDSTAEEFKLGFHQIFESNGKKLVEAYYAEILSMITQLKPTIIGHIDKIKMFNTHKTYFDDDSAYYRDAVIQVINAAKNTDCIIEFNTRGFYKHAGHMPYPSLWALKEMNKLGIRLCLNSDCHSPYEIVSGFDEAVQLLLTAGYNSQWQLFDGKWVEGPLIS